MIEVIPTVVPKKFADIEQFVSRSKIDAPMFHIDTTDGDFAFPTTWVPQQGEMLPEHTSFEVHLMARDARAMGERFINAGAWRIIGHAEVLSGEDGERTLLGWRAMGAREVGVAVLLGTPLTTVEHLAAHADSLLLMSIGKIGAQGQAFQREALHHIAEARERFPHLVIGVDGGINESNITDVVRAGASRVCVGSAITKADDAAASYAHLLNLAMSAVQ